MSLLDMIGPVMIGPSSSHTAGACRIGLAARQLLGHNPEKARIGLYASFAKTGKGHGTHLALIAGILGFEPHDPRLPQAFQEAEKAGLDFEFHDADLGNVHPNTALIHLQGGQASVEVTASSTGGGIIEVIEVDGFKVAFDGFSPTLLLKYQDAYGMISRVTGLIAIDEVNIASLTCTREKRGGTAMMCIVLDSGLSDYAIRKIAHIPEISWIRMLPGFKRL